MVNVRPKIAFYLNNTKLKSATLSESSRNFKFQFELPAGDHEFSLQFRNKQYHNYPPGQDMAVVIQHIGFQYLPDDFKNFSFYRPEYPEPWATEQRNQGIHLKPEVYADCLGWNGVWGIRFQTPIYPWIHKTLNLGWLL